ncbi:unnamed protein product [Gadus morhua 'NCC']
MKHHLPNNRTQSLQAKPSATEVRGVEVPRRLGGTPSDRPTPEDWVRSGGRSTVTLRPPGPPLSPPLWQQTGVDRGGAVTTDPSPVETTQGGGLEVHAQSSTGLGRWLSALPPSLHILTHILELILGSRPPLPHGSQGRPLHSRARALYTG